MGRPLPQALLPDPTGVVQNVWRPGWNSHFGLNNEGSELIRGYFLCNNEILYLKCRQKLVSPFVRTRLDTSRLNYLFPMSD